MSTMIVSNKEIQYRFGMIYQLRRSIAATGSEKVLPMPIAPTDRSLSLIVSVLRHTSSGPTYWDLTQSQTSSDT